MGEAIRCPLEERVDTDEVSRQLGRGQKERRRRTSPVANMAVHGRASRCSDAK